MSLSTHILDVSRGAPAAGVAVTLYRIGTDRVELARAVTDVDGRVAAPFGGTLEAGWYELLFEAGAYFASAGLKAFYNEIPIRFRIDPGEERYHIPLLLAPWGYSTYRGS